MPETQALAGLAAEPGLAVEAGERIDALLARGAQHFDPAGLQYVRALAKRAAASHGGQRAEVDRRLAAALEALCARFGQAAEAARELLADGSARFPKAAGQLAEHYQRGDFSALERLLARLHARARSRALTELLEHIGRQTPSAKADHGAPGDAPVQELRSMRYFRRTWSRLNVDRQLSRAHTQAPENAGPLNSHHLVLQTLAQMREISPEYLGHFICWADTLLWLEQADLGRSAAHKGAARGEREQPRKPSRRKTR